MKVTWSKVDLVKSQDTRSVYKNQKQLENKIKNKAIFIFPRILCSRHNAAKWPQEPRCPVRKSCRGGLLGAPADQEGEGREGSQSAGQSWAHIPQDSPG